MLVTLRRFSCVWLGLVAAGCSLQGTDLEENSGLEPDDGVEEVAAPSSSEGAVVASDNQDIPPLDEEGCHAIYAQDILPTFELTIAPEVMAGLYEDWVLGTERDRLDVDETPYHPVKEFRYGDIAITDARIRLRGNPTYWLEQNKMQFQVSFDEVNPNGRFLGLRKVLFDAATFNRHFLRDRLSLWIMRRVGIQAPCANNARLFINGEYYGLYTSIEKLDEAFLERNFENPTGDLWKRTNWEIKTNEDTATRERIDVIRKADERSQAELEAVLDVEQAILVWAADAVLPNSDGPWAGGFNYYFYDDPARGKMVLLPWDLDNTFTRLEPNVDPYTFQKEDRFRGREAFEKLLADDDWFDLYVETINNIVSNAYNTDLLHAKIGEWTQQIQSAALEDRNKPYTNQRYVERIGILRNFIQQRADFLAGWLDCWNSGGQRDEDGNCVLPLP